MNTPAMGSSYVPGHADVEVQWLLLGAPIGIAGARVQK